MARFTTTVRSVCEMLSGRTEAGDRLSIDQVIEAARPLIFDFCYPLTDQSHKAELETKILLHYYMQEIGLETVGAWRHALRVKMLEIMPYFDELYKSAALKYDPLHNVDYYRESHSTGENSTTSTESAAGSTSGTSSSDRTNQDLYSNTPEGTLTGVDSGTHLSDYRKNLDHSTGTTSGTSQDSRSAATQGDQSADSLEHVYGNQGGSYLDMIAKLRDNILNIDLMVIEALDPLFMGLWE